MTKKHLFLLFLLSSFVILFNSCKDDSNEKLDPYKTLLFKLTIPTDEFSVSDFTAKAIDSRSNAETNAELKDGVLMIKLEPGTYDFIVEAKKEKLSAFGQLQKVSVTNESNEISINVDVFSKSQQGFIFREVFHNGETNKPGGMMHHDQYVVLHNSSEHTLYADGLLLAASAHHTAHQDCEFTAELPNLLCVVGILQIPGNGTDYPVKPGEDVVIAAWGAHDYKEIFGEQSVDLSGADFEFGDMMGRFKGSRPDNPDVPNLKPIHADEWGLSLHPRGYYSPVILRAPDDIDIVNYSADVANKKDQKFTWTNPNNNQVHEWIIQSVKIPVEWILDGIDTGDTFAQANGVKALPASVDKGAIYVSGCHRGELVVRKFTEKNGRKYYIDTNNTTEDCEILFKQNAFPKGWRELKK